MDDKMRNSESDLNDTDCSQKPSRKRRTPSGSPARSDSRRRRSPSRSVSPVRDVRKRRHSRSRSPDRRYGRYNNRGGGYQRDYRRNRSPSPDYRSNAGRSRNSRRSRSTSVDRFRNRRNLSPSPERSMSQKMRGDSRPPNFQNEYPTGQYHTEYIPSYSNQQNYPNQPYPNYDYQVPMQPVPGPNSYLQPFSAPPPPVIGDFQNQNVQYQMPPPPVITEPKPFEADEEKQKREAAIALEKKNQRETLRKQRDEYFRRATALKKELITLKEQREELSNGDEPPSPTTSGFLNENDRLQTQIQNKIKSMENVIDMLNGIIHAEKPDSPKKIKSGSKADTRSDDKSDSSPERLKTKVLESLSRKRHDSGRTGNEEKSIKTPTKEEERVNYTFYDPEQHWCKACATFPKSAKEFLGHLHSEDHKNNVKPPEIPWHDHLVNDDMPTYANAPSKRIPIRGLQFFVPSVAWYCKLCAIWIGDLHCASSHLKSKTHGKEFEKFIQKNPTYETDWLQEREKAFNQHLQKKTETKSDQLLSIPPQSVVSSKVQMPAVPPPMAPLLYGNATAVFDSIPLQINQRVKEVPTIVAEETEKKKGKKKKKDKKKKSKKSKKKHRRSSSSSTSSSSEDTSESEAESERKPAPEPIIDTSTSIRVAMRNVTKTHLKPKSDDESETPGGWTVVQEAKIVAPQPPTISANGEAQNRRDELLINQWNAPTPVISDKEKQLLEQLKGKLKTREEKKKEKTPPQAIEKPQFLTSRESEESFRRNDEKRDDKRRDDRDRRDVQRRRRSSSSPRRDRRSRSPRRDRRRRSRSRSITPRRDRRSRSPRRDRRRRSPSHDSRERRERSDSKFMSLNDKRAKEKEKEKEKENDRKKLANEKSNNNKKPSSSSASNATKKLPFIGRMPVLKKQSAEEDAKKPETPADNYSEEERIIRQKKQEEIKFHLLQTKQLLHQQQKQAEAFNLAHPGKIDHIYHQHGSIHHVLPHAQQEYEDLMPDPMHYVMMPVPPPPDSTETTETSETDAQQPLFEEPVLPPGIDQDELENMETIVPDVPAKDVLPKDFQDALSILFDKEDQPDGTKVSPNTENKTSTNETTIESGGAMHDENSAYAAMDVVMDTQEQMEIDSNAATTAMQSVDEQAQYLLYGGLSENALYGDLSTHPIIDGSIPMPGSVLDATHDGTTQNDNGNQMAGIDDINAKNRRLQELDDLAMLGIDAEDLAAQCI